MSFQSPAASGLLLVEDDEDSAELMQRVLRRAGHSVDRAGSIGEARNVLLSRRFSALLLDFRLPDGESWPLLDHIREQDPHIPVVLVTAMGDERVAAEAMHRGAADYVIKSGDFWERLPEIVERVLRTAEAQAMLRRSEQLQRAILGALPASIALLDEQGVIVAVNRAWREFMTTCGADHPDACIGENYLDTCAMTVDHAAHHQEALLAGAREVLAGNLEQFAFEFDVLRGEEQFWHRLIISPVGSDNSPGAVVMYMDITDRVRTEVALQLQKDLLQNVFQCVGDGIYVVDGQGRLLQHNPRAAEILGMPAVDLPPEQWVKYYGCQQEDGVTPIVAGEFPLYRAISGESVQEEVFIQNENVKSGRFLNINAAPLRGEGNAIIGGIAIFSDITQRKVEEQERQRLAAAVEQSAEIILMTDTSFHVVYSNPAYTEITRLGPREILGLGFFETVVAPGGRTETAAIRQALTEGRPYQGRIECSRRGMEKFTAEVVAAPVHDRTGKTIYHVFSLHDVTRQLELERQLGQSQKMEAIGQLAGGVAHDFNNLLTVIRGYGEFVQDVLPRNSEESEAITELLKAADSATSLTRQLLAFARKQVLKTEDINLNDVVVNVEKILNRLLEENIECSLRLEPQLDLVLADPGQIEQILINLAVNARDAMPEGGLLQIATRNEVLDEAYASGHLDIAPGRYVLLSVSDTGCGMDDETQAHVFEPFFSTKEVGHGTGLGLSTVYGIVKQSGGHIWVYSEPNKGTTFKIYLPVSQSSKATRPSSAETSLSPKGNESVLVVEDNQAIRNLVSTALTRSGYEVFSAGTPAEALRLAREISGPIHLIVSDIVMPGESGPVLREKILEAHPEAKVLFMSGYSEDIIMHRGEFDASYPLIQKPFTPRALLKMVRDILDEPSS